MNSAACVVSGSRKYDRVLTQLLHVELRWLDVPERIKYKLSMMTRRCLNGTTPQYLAAHCVPVSATASRQHLRSAAASHQLVVPSYRLTSYGRRSSYRVYVYRYICVILSALHSSFWRLLKTFFFSEHKCIQRIRDCSGVDAL